MMSPQKKEELISEVQKVEISLELVKAFVDTWKGKEEDIWFSGEKWKEKKKQAKKALEKLEKFHNRGRELEKNKDDVMKFEIVFSCSCTPKLGAPI